MLLVVGAAFLVVLRYAPVLFYSWEFNDFIDDEAKFAPMRETDDRQHLVAHILEQGFQFGMVVDKDDVVVTKIYHPESGITTLAVDVGYTVPMNFYLFNYQARFRHHTTTNY